MGKRKFLFAAAAAIAGAAALFDPSPRRGGETRAPPTRPGFLAANAPQVLPRGQAVSFSRANVAGAYRRNAARFMLDGKPFRFAGANVAVMYRDDDRRMMSETLRQAAQAGIKVVRVWASGEGGPDDVKPIADYNDWPRTHSFRNKPDEWNEAEFAFLDLVLEQAAKNGLRVQLCLWNWWRDTGGVTQYLRWAGINGADDDKSPFGITNEKP